MAIGRGTTEFYVSVDETWFQNPTGLEQRSDVEGYVKTRIDGSSYLLYGFLNGEEKVILGARMDDLDFFLESLATTPSFSLGWCCPFNHRRLLPMEAGSLNQSKKLHVC